MVFNNPRSNKAKQTKIIACATVIHEMLTHLPPDVDYTILDFGLHVNPDVLRRSLQDTIDASSTSFDTILLGYGKTTDDDDEQYTYDMLFHTHTHWTENEHLD